MFRKVATDNNAIQSLRKRKIEIIFLRLLWKRITNKFSYVLSYKKQNPQFLIF